MLFCQCVRSFRNVCVIRSLPCRRSSRGAGTRDEPLRTSAGEAMEYALRTACTLCCVFFRSASSLRTDVFNVLIFLPWKFAFCLGNRMILSFASSLRSLSRLVVRARLLFFIIYSKRVFCLVEWQNKNIKIFVTLKNHSVRLFAIFLKC